MIETAMCCKACPYSGLVPSPTGALEFSKVGLSLLLVQLFIIGQMCRISSQIFQTDLCSPYQGGYLYMYGFKKQMKEELRALGTYMQHLREYPHAAPYMYPNYTSQYH